VSVKDVLKDPYRLDTNIEVQNSYWLMFDAVHYVTSLTILLRRKRNASIEVSGASKGEFETEASMSDPLSTTVFQYVFLDISIDKRHIICMSYLIYWEIFKPLLSTASWRTRTLCRVYSESMTPPVSTR
jgi:hypothetical protein